MQIIGREKPAIVVQILNGRVIGRLVRDHASLLWQFAAFAQVAGRTGCDNIFPGRFPAMGAWYHMIERQIIFGSAILALELVAQKNVEPRKRRVAGRLNIVFQADNTWQSHGETGRRDRVFVFSNDVYTVKKNSLD